MNDDVVEDLNKLLAKYKKKTNGKYFCHEVLIFSITLILDEIPSRQSALKFLQNCIQEVIECWQEEQEE